MEFTHVAKPVLVKAQEIFDVIACRSSGMHELTLEDGAVYKADIGMTARHIPQTGDYLVTQEDGYEYLNPKDVFERKYVTIAGGGASTSKPRCVKAADDSLSAEARQRLDQIRVTALSFAQGAIWQPGSADEVIK